MSLPTTGKHIAIVQSCYLDYVNKNTNSLQVYFVLTAPGADGERISRKYYFGEKIEQAMIDDFARMGSVLHVPNEIISAAKQLIGSVVELSFFQDNLGASHFSIKSYIGRDNPEKYCKTMID